MAWRHAERPHAEALQSDRVELKYRKKLLAILTEIGFNRTVWN